MDVLNESNHLNIICKKEKQKIRDEIRKLIIEKMNIGLKPQDVADTYKVNAPAVREI
jgi:hypothetical protein